MHWFASKVACELLYAFRNTGRDAVVFYDVDGNDHRVKTAVLKREDVVRAKESEKAVRFRDSIATGSIGED